MEVHEFSDILQDIAHEGRAEYNLKINGIKFNHDDLKIIRNDKNNIVEINLNKRQFSLTLKLNCDTIVLRQKLKLNY